MFHKKVILNAILEEKSGLYLFHDLFHANRFKDINYTLDELIFKGHYEAF